MGFTGTGSFVYDNKIGALEYAAQEILKTEDKNIPSVSKAVTGALSDVKDAILDFKGSAVRFYDKQTQNQSKMMSDLSTLIGTVAGLPSVITGETDRVLVPVTKIENQLATISKSMSGLYTSLEGSRASISGLSDIANNIYNKLDNMSNNGQDSGPEAPPPIPDMTPDYSDALNNISDIIGSIRDSISGFDGGSDPSKFYSGFHADLDKLKDVISELVGQYNSEAGFDAAGFTAAVQSLVGNFTEGFVDAFADVVIPEMQENYAAFAESFVTEFKNAFQEQSEDLLSDLTNKGNDSGNNPLELDGVVVDISGDSFNAYSEKITDIISQFHADIVERLDNIDEDFVSGLVTVDRSVRSSGKSGSGGKLDDLIDSFDDDTQESISTGKSILSWLKESKITTYLSSLVGMFTFANIKADMDRVYEQTRLIAKQTGLNRSEASDLRSDIAKNIAATYGMATFSQAERDLAFNNAINAGMVAADQLNKATEATLAYEKLLGTQLDLTSGWAKQIMVTKSDADEYLEDVALALDDFQNNFYVSADKLQQSAGAYVSAALLFSKDRKEFGKSMRNYLSVVAAQEDANIRSMDMDTFARTFATTPLYQQNETMIRMVSQAGLTDLGKAQMLAANDPQKFAEIMWEHAQRKQEQYKDDMTSGSASRYQSALIDFNYNIQADGGDIFDFATDDFASAIENSKNGKAAELAEANGDLSALKEKTQETSVLSLEDQVKNIADYLKDDKDSFVGKIYNRLLKMGVSGNIAAAVGGIIMSIISNIAGRVFVEVLKGNGHLILEGIKGFGGKFGSVIVKAIHGIPSGIVNGFSWLKGFLTGLFPNLGSIVKGVAKVGGAVKSIWDAGAGAVNSEKWVGGNDNDSKIAAGAGGLIGGGEGGVGNAVKNGIKWAAVGTAIAPVVGTIIGGIAGTVAGAIGGDKISKGIKAVTDKANDINDSIDLAAEKNLGTFGRVLSAIKNTYIDFNKNVLGGVYRGLGDIVGGVKDGFSKILQGDFLGGLKDIFMGLITGIKDIFMGPINALKDIWDDWTLSAEERIAKRKKKLDDVTKEAENAAKKADSKTDDVTKRTSKAGQIQRTGKAIFSDNGSGRAGSTSAAGLNRASFTDYEAAKFIQNDKPITHVPGKKLNAGDFGITDSPYVRDLKNEDTVLKIRGNYVPYDQERFDSQAEADYNNSLADLTSGGGSAVSYKPVLYGSKEYEEITNKPKTRIEESSDEINNTSPVLYGSNEYEEITNKPKSRVVNEITPQNSDSVTKPIVDSINTNLSSVISLLRQLVNSTTGNNNQQKTAKAVYPTAPVVNVENRADSMDLLNVAGKEMGVV